MKISFSTSVVLLLSHASMLTGAQKCAPPPMQFSETVALGIEKYAAVPTSNTAAFSYNMAVMDNIDGKYTYFIDQSNGFIYSLHSKSKKVKTVFDMNKSNIPAGITLDWEFSAPSATFRVKSMSQGTKKNEVIIVFTSSTLPDGWKKPDTPLPPLNAYGKYVCGRPGTNATWMADIYRPGVLPDCWMNGAGLKTFAAYDVFYRYTLKKGKLTKPKAFFVNEHTVVNGHLGGGIATLDNGQILWSTGDGTVFGLDGHYAPQLDFESAGKILLLDPKKKGFFKIVAKGVRNSQQMRLFPKGKEDHLAFMEIGGVTAEEVNAVSLDELVKGEKPVNFGWGRNLHDGKAREGTFYVKPGNAGVLGYEPMCDDEAPQGEAGFTQPWIQFGRTAEDFYYGICSLAIPSRINDKLKLLWSEFNTGHLMGAEDKFVKGAAPVTGYKLKMYDNKGVLLENGLNDLVKKELGEVGYYRGDPRLFHFPNGDIGVFIERTGVIYKVTETEVPM